jgi:hypothetical protein
MQVTPITRHDPSIVSRYLAHQLTDAQRSAFEQQLLDDPDAVWEIEATARLKIGLQRLRESGQLDSLMGGVPLLQQPWVRALAASLVVFALVVGYSHWNAPAARPLLAASVAALVDQAGRAVPVGATYALLRTRVTTDDAVIELPESPQAIALRVLPETPAQPPRYRIALEQMRADGSLKEVASIAHLAASADGFVTVFADASALVPGRYRLVVAGDASGDGVAPDAFVIRTVARSPR